MAKNDLISGSGKKTQQIIMFLKSDSDYTCTYFSWLPSTSKWNLEQNTPSEFGIQNAKAAAHWTLKTLSLHSWLQGAKMEWNQNSNWSAKSFFVPTILHSVCPKNTPEYFIFCNKNANKSLWIVIEIYILWCTFRAIGYYGLIWKHLSGQNESPIPQRSRPFSLSEKFMVNEPLKPTEMLTSSVWAQIPDFMRCLPEILEKPIWVTFSPDT